ncbi:LysR family transcriptional regulator [Legionella spiritensis]|uniref:Transcriptional regulator n=1 Tax=Legionella spiritensis TaxID=452 RepID=A0A0W0Z535_LEGSP|nr:LysR family transcriptional regulator [Legionella spiritensis]KTD64046.1 transcriptional regulator [Legionella spiritensis]SNV37398.1 transcriptional regulator [Legionella spiritensis]
MKINQSLQCFMKAAETLHFATAARMLHITPTALSKQIKKLEQQIGMQLFQRTTRKIILTEMGQRLYQRCRKLDEEITGLNQFIENKKNEPQGTLRVLVSTILARHWLLQHLKEFRALYPKIELELIFTEQDQDLADSKADIMMGFPEIPPYTNDLKFRYIYTVKNILCASPDYIERYGLPETKAELSTAHFISHTLRKPKHQLPLADGGYITINRPVLLMNEFDALNQACKDGHGIFLTGDVLVQKELARGELVQILPDIDFRHYRIYLFYRAYDYELPKVRVFVDFYNHKSDLQANTPKS